MSLKTDRSYGIAILVGVVLMTITMDLHPAGGGIEHLIAITQMIVFTHTIAIISIPLLIYGAWGLTRRLDAAKGMPISAFITFSTGMFAVMIAAALNGLALPFFVNGLENADAETLKTAKLIISYGFGLNQAFDIIFIIFVSAATIIWSVAILRSKRLPAWLGILGILAGSLALITLASGFVLTHLMGFRFFMAGFILWLLLVGIQLLKPTERVG